MNAQELNGREPRRVWIIVTRPSRSDHVADLCRLARMEPVVVPRPDEEVFSASPGSEDILVTEGSAREVPLELRGLPRVRLDWRDDEYTYFGYHDFRMPDDQDDFLRFLYSLSIPDEAALQGSSRVTLVGAWHGGGGATTAARSMAEAGGSVFMDAAGNRGGPVPEDDGPSWWDLEVGDLPSARELVSSFPEYRGVMVLGPGWQAPVRPDDPRVLEVLRVINCDAVVDCGTNLDSLNMLAVALESSGIPVAVVVVGRASDTGSHALGQVCATKTIMGPATYLVSGRPDRMFDFVAQRFQLKCRTFPRRNSRRWASIQEALWKA